MAPITHPGPLLNATLDAAKLIPTLEHPTKVTQTYRLQRKNGAVVAVPYRRVKERVTLSIADNGRYRADPDIDAAQSFTDLARDPVFASKVSEEFIVKAAETWCRVVGLGHDGRWGMLNSATDVLNAILLRRKGISPEGLLNRLAQIETTEEAS